MAILLSEFTIIKGIHSGFMVIVWAVYIILQQIGYSLSALPDAVREGSKRFLIKYNDKQD